LKFGVSEANPAGRPAWKTLGSKKTVRQLRQQKKSVCRKAPLGSLTTTCSKSVERHDGHVNGDGILDEYTV
jgi:hypothetical protein